ncbi:phosphoenolpyruvate carboxykinase (ATP) [Pedobacter sp. PWIIR3]
MNKGFTIKPGRDYPGLSGELARYQRSPEALSICAIENGEGVITSTGALAIDTGKFTGRSPKDRYIVEDEFTADSVFWGDVNIPFDAGRFDTLLAKMIAALDGKPYYVRDAAACADPEFQIPIRVITETAYQNLFAHHLFLRPDEANFSQKVDNGWIILAIPSFLADPKKDGTRQTNFSILNFSRRMILIGGTGYTGEIKKGIFSVLNFLLPAKEVLPMHCSANVGKKGDTAIFFGLSGTGKTTLSADPYRRLIGDDEHGWSASKVFNFEGGCYAKVAGLSPEKEPQIFAAVKPGALLENVDFFPASNIVDYNDISKTENTRVAYPINYIDGAVVPSVAGIPQNIFFLTCDAFGVLPPISKLDAGQAMFHFLSGYTAKVAGTETGISEPQLTFSACFGKAFLPLNPVRYASLLGEKLKNSK